LAAVQLVGSRWLNKDRDRHIKIDRQMKSTQGRGRETRERERKRETIRVSPHVANGPPLGRSHPISQVKIPFE
jgi:hypothetical protein